MLTRCNEKTPGTPPPSNKLHLVDPVGYLEMVHLLKHFELVIADSGGLQKQAYFFTSLA
ncbi:MAG: UDP-N-acetylglucosamine 2-epimerase [Cyclobacteriaceae bacterium]